MNKMRNLGLIILAITSISCNAQDKKTKKESEKYVVAYQKDGKTVIDTVSIQDTTLQSELQRMMKSPNYKPNKSQNDTIFNSKGNPTLVKLEDDIFGASIQKFEYDSSDRLVRITGYDNQNNIKPFDKDIAFQTFKYDTNGNIIEIRNHGDDGNLITSEFEDTPIIKRVYNENGQQIEEWYLNEQGELRSPFAIAKYEYTQDGERKLIGWFNEKAEKK